MGQNIIHEKIYNVPNNIPCKVEAFVKIPQSKINRFSLLYRSKNNLEYIEKSMIPIGVSKHFAEIPGNFLNRESIEYYLLLELTNGERFTFPEIDAIENPIIISVNDPLGKRIPITLSEKDNFEIRGLNPQILILSPKPGERVYSQDIFISLSYFSEENIDISKIEISIDGVNVTELANKHATYLTIIPKSMKPGVHTVNVMLTNNFNQKYNDFNWSFTVLPDEVSNRGIIQKQSGKLWTNSTQGSIGNTIINYNEINFDYNIFFNWLSFRAKFKKSSLENEYFQPYNRYSFHLKNKFMDIIIGDSYPFFNQEIINGQHLRGIDATISQGPLSIQILNGLTAHAVQGDPHNGSVIAYIDSSSSDWSIYINRSNYTFQQELFGAKVSLDLTKNIKWNFNYIKLEDNINSISSSNLNSKIMITTSDSIYNIQYGDLLNNYKQIFGNNTSLTSIPLENWWGMKPQSNFIYGSDIKFNFDGSRFQFHGGFSISYYNRNIWNSISNIQDFDTLSIDNVMDESFFNSISLNNSAEISKFKKYYSLGTNQSPLLPLMFQEDGSNLFNFFNMSNLHRYNKLKLRYLGHIVELGNKRTGPDYYSVLNPSFKINYSENYFSDRINLFENKLLLYYKKSKLKEKIYSDQKDPMQINNDFFNVSLYPGEGLPSFNMGFVSSYKKNNEKKTIDYVTYTSTDAVNDIDTIIYVKRLEIVNKLFNLSMTDEFQLFRKNIINFNAILYQDEDKINDRINQDTLLLIGYIPKDANSKSFDLSLKTIINDYWESTIAINTNSYNYIKSNISSVSKQFIHQYRLNLLYRFKEYSSEIVYGFQYSKYWGNDNLKKINFNFSLESQFIRDFHISFILNYNILLNHQNQFESDSFLKAHILYNIM